jgi:hypothetical protein
MDLSIFEFPRHVHRPSYAGQWRFRVVRNAQECAAALAEGWSLTCTVVPDGEPLPDEAPVPVVGSSEPEPEPVVEPRRRGRPRKVA